MSLADYYVRFDDVDSIRNGIRDREYVQEECAREHGGVCSCHGGVHREFVAGCIAIIVHPGNILSQS